MNFKIGLSILTAVLLVFAIAFGSEIKFFFAQQTTTVNIISVVGTVITVTSFIFGLYEKSERDKLETKRKSQLWATLDRARYVTFDHTS